MAKLLRSTWPGPVTWIFPARAELHPLLTGGRQTVAVRLTSDTGAAALCEAFAGVLISTSANLSATQAARSRLRVQRVFGTLIDGIAPGRVGQQCGSSTIRDIASAQVLQRSVDGD